MRAIARPALISSRAPGPGGRGRMARIAPPWTKNAFRQPGVRWGAIRQVFRSAQSFEPADPLEEVLESIDAVAEPDPLSS